MKTTDFFSLFFCDNKISYVRLITEGKQECLGMFQGSACVRY